MGICDSRVTFATEREYGRFDSNKVSGHLDICIIYQRKHFTFDKTMNVSSFKDKIINNLPR